MVQLNLGAEVPQPQESYAMRTTTTTLICAVAFSIVPACASYAQFAPANVIVAQVIERPVAPVRTFVAAVRPLRKSVVGTAVGGRVERFLYDEESPETKLTFVRKGQPLAHLREGTIGIRVDAAVAHRDFRQAEWEEADQTHVGLVEQAQAKLKAATEKLRFFKTQHDRNRALYERNRSISLEAYERSRVEVFSAEQEFVEAKIDNHNLKRRDRIKQAKAQLDEAEAVLAELKDRMKKYTIAAPFDGFVVAEHTEVGEWIREGDPVAEVVQLHPVEVRAFVPEKYVRQLQVGGKAVVRPSAALLPSESIPQGRITGVVAEAVTRSRTFPVKIQVDNPDYLLKAGMLAEVELMIGDRQLATLVPKDALVLGGPVPRIFLATPDPKDPKAYIAKMMPVKQGVSLGKWIAVTAIGDEIVAGDLVIEKGNERLRPGAPLVVNREGASPPPPKR